MFVTIALKKAQHFFTTLFTFFVVLPLLSNFSQNVLHHVRTNNSEKVGRH